MKLRMQPGIYGALVLVGSLVLVAALPSVVAAPAPQEGADAVAEAPSEAPQETPAEEPAAAESGDTVEEIIEGVLEDLEDVLEEVDPAEDARVYRGGEVSIMTSIHIPANEVHRGDVVCIGCDAVIDGEVHGDIVVVGGSLDLNGKAGHDVVCVLSEVNLGPDSSVHHDFVNVLSSLDDRGAHFGNERIVVEPFIGLPSIGGAFGVLGGIILWGKLLKIVVVFLVILILAIFVPERIRVLSDEFPVSYGLALVAGFGGYIVLWLVNTLLAISVIGIPVAILLHLLFLVLKVMGLLPDLLDRDDPAPPVRNRGADRGHRDPADVLVPVRVSGDRADPADPGRGTASQPAAGGASRGAGASCTAGVRRTSADSGAAGSVGTGADSGASALQCPWPSSLANRWCSRALGKLGSSSRVRSKAASAACRSPTRSHASPRLKLNPGSCGASRVPRA